MLINSIPLLEARAGSEIENIVTTTDRLFQFADDRESLADLATKEVLRYRAALREGFESLPRHPLTTRTAVDICRTIKGVDIDIRKTPGTALMNDRSGEVIYTPPEGEARIRDQLANWEHFLHEAEHIDPLVRMAIGHYQFETIHPFVDGNGRTGRVLSLLYLVEQGLLDIPVLYLSKAIIEAKQDYDRLLLNVSRDSAWEPWILFILSAVRSTAHWTTSRIKAIRAHRRYRRADEARRTRYLLPRVDRADLRTALLPHRQRRRRQYRPTPNSIGLFEATRRYRLSSRSEGRTGEAPH